MHKLFILFIFFFSILANAQDSVKIKQVLKFQEALNQKFSVEDTSPLSEEALRDFKRLDFFDIDTAYSLVARFVRTPHETPFIMRTTTDREPLYVKYGEAHFTIQNKKFVLSIYQNQGLKTQTEYENYLFLPFTDLTNEDITYAGGRFIDLKIPKNDVVIIDFNTAYTPYCAYNPNYSCPIPPKENHMDILIPVGVKKNEKLQENK